MKSQAIQYQKVDGGFHQSIDAFEPTKSDAIAAMIGSSGATANAIVQIAFGTSLKIQFFEVIQIIRAALHKIVAGIQIHNQETHFIRSESGKWQSHSEYIRESIERQKLRIYDFRGR